MTKKISVIDADEEELLSFLLAESGKPVTFLALFQRDDIPDACPETRDFAGSIARLREDGQSGTAHPR